MDGLVLLDRKTVNTRYSLSIHTEKREMENNWRWRWGKESFWGKSPICILHFPCDKAATDFLEHIDFLLYHSMF